MGSKEQATSEQPTFKAATEFVQVPVIVQRSGKHVSGLSKNDFTLEQDGKSQAIATFEEVHAGAAQRRTRNGLLIQGSIQPPPLALARTDLEGAVCQVAQADQGVTWETVDDYWRPWHPPDGPGTNGVVYSLCSDGQGRVYVAGTRAACRVVM